MSRAGSFCALTAAALLAAAPAGAQSRPPTTADRIANALAAAPAAISAEAAVRDWPAAPGGEMTTLREGSNGWTCLPDDPMTRGNDPACLDDQWLAFMTAALKGERPKLTRVGYAYMLNSDAWGSNTVLGATERTADNQWHHLGPHVMIAYPDSQLLAGLPTEPQESAPYVMFPGTPYAHVMVPVGGH